MLNNYIKAGYSEAISKELIRLSLEYGRKVEYLPPDMTIPELEIELQKTNTLGY